MPNDISDRDGNKFVSFFRINSISGTDVSFKISRKSPRAIDTDNRKRFPLALRCSSPSTIIGANSNLTDNLKYNLKRVQKYYHRRTYLK